MTVPYPAFADFVAPARPNAALWRLGLGLVLGAAVYVVGVFAVLGAAWLLAGAGRSPVGFFATVAGAATPRDALILMATFAAMALAPVVAARVMHRRGPATLIGPARRAARDFAVAAAIVIAVYAPTLGLWFWRFDAVPNLDPALWAAVLPLTLLGLAVQTGAEELLFRGYLQQQLGARFRSPLVWLLLPSLAFAAAHWDPVNAGGNVWLVVGATLAFGLAAADLTATTGSLGAAWGFHFANNFAAIGLVAIQGTIPGLALFLTPYGADDTDVMRGLVLLDILTLAVAWALVRRALRR